MIGDRSWQVKSRTGPRRAPSFNAGGIISALVGGILV
jgi:hypothetical protein